MKKIYKIIRQIRPEEYSLLQEFLYQAIYIPEGTKPPPRSVVDLPELQVYVAGFGTQPGDYCLVAEIAGTVVGAAWSRIMQDYGHIDDRTPSLAISLLPEYRGLGIGAQLLRSLLLLLQENGYLRLSLSVQKNNPALRLYERAGFRILAEKGTEYLMLRDITQSVQQENTDMETTMEKQQENKIQQWFSMWLDRQDTGIEDLFAPDAVYIESWGPAYRGREKIKLWFDEWNTRGTVERWDIRQYFHKEDQTVVELCRALTVSPSFAGMRPDRYAFYRNSAATKTAMTPMPTGKPPYFVTSRQCGFERETSYANFQGNSPLPLPCRAGMANGNRSGPHRVAQRPCASRGRERNPFHRTYKKWLRHKLYGHRLQTAPPLGLHHGKRQHVRLLGGHLRGDSGRRPANLHRNRKRQTLVDVPFCSWISETAAEAVSGRSAKGT